MVRFASHGQQPFAQYLSNTEPSSPNRGDGLYNSAYSMKQED